MTFKTKLLAIALIGCVMPVVGAELTDDEVKAALIKQSIEAYPRRCPCPYSLDSAGRQCGARSAWSKPGGATPYCYPADITSDMVREWRAKHAVVKA